MVDRAYQKFDKDGSGVITADDLRGVYKVQAKDEKEDEVYKKFLARFGDKDGDG